MRLGGTCAVNHPLLALCVLALGVGALTSPGNVVGEGEPGGPSPTVEGSDATEVGEATKDEYLVGLYEVEPPRIPRGKQIRMVSSAGRAFTCVLPSDSDEAEEEEAEEDTEDDLREGIMRRVRKALESHCLAMNQGYWTYEVCFFGKVTQFHGDVGSRTEFDLGTYRSDLDDLPLLDGMPSPTSTAAGADDAEGHRAALPAKTNLHGLAYAQRYVGGAGGRRTVVNMVCNPSGRSIGDIVEVNEPSEFHYDITISTPTVCLQQHGGSQASMPVAVLLKPLRQQCVYLNQGWWSYEFCYEEHLRQFHLETVPAATGNNEVREGEAQTITTVEFMLGRFLSNSTLDVHPHENPANSYAVQDYADGTLCDLTGQPRRVSVRYICDSDSPKSRIASIQETSTCEYSMVLATPLICGNKKFRPIQPKLNQIKCFPEGEFDDEDGSDEDGSDENGSDEDDGVGGSQEVAGSDIVEREPSGAVGSSEQLVLDSDAVDGKSPFVDRDDVGSVTDSSRQVNEPPIDEANDEDAATASVAVSDDGEPIAEPQTRFEPEDDERVP